MDKTVLEISFVLGVVIYVLAAMLSIVMAKAGGDPWYGIIWVIGAYPFVKIMGRLSNLINGKIK